MESRSSAAKRALDSDYLTVLLKPWVVARHRLFDYAGDNLNADRFLEQRKDLHIFRLRCNGRI